MESKKINQLATELAPDLSDLTIIGDPTTGISKKITLSQMASLFTGTVEEYANLAAFPLVGVADTIYVALDTNIIYRYDTSLSTYVILSPNIINSLVFSDANGFDGTITLVGSVATLSITTALTLGSVPFIGASGALIQDNANLFFDDTNNRLGIATALPTTPLDVFGSGIIGRLNATSTNNAFLGFASNGTNKWSAGNVQSDHRFRIFSEANSAELITILQTGEFGIGIANPTTKFHIDGAASALIANLDANVSIAKSVSYRSDNSARINLEVSGTESGSNAGADFFLRTFTDAGSLLETPFTIVRSTGVTTIKSLTLTNVLSVANGGTGSASQNFVDLTTTQSIGGAKTFISALAGTIATFSGTITASGADLRANTGALVPVGVIISSNYDIPSNPKTLYTSYGQSTILGGHEFRSVNGSGTGSITSLYLSPSGAATFLSNITAGGYITGQGTNPGGLGGSRFILDWLSGYMRLFSYGANASTNGGFVFNSQRSDGTNSFDPMTILPSGNVLIGTTSDSGRKLQVDGAVTALFLHNTNNTSGAFLNIWQLGGSNTNNTSSYYLYCDTDALGVRVVIYGNGNIANVNNSYGAYSDIKLKENIVDATPKLDDLLKVKIRNYNLIADESKTKQIGVIAQELEEIFPALIEESNDIIKDENGENVETGEKTKNVKYSIFVPMLIKAIQELKAELDELKAKIK